MEGLPQGIHVGMRVFDNHHRHIGVVDDFKYSDEDPSRPGPETAGINPGDMKGRDSIIDNLAEAFHPNELPEEIRERLLNEGYVRLDADGLFAADRYILPEQIASVGDDEITLTVDSKDELIKRV
ncbi:hypothetical protein XM25_16435 [Devosia sp. H5989]|nr:hypothetical protein XM25_16435 [Devosia sp. H5989]